MFHIFSFYRTVDWLHLDLTSLLVHSTVHLYTVYSILPHRFHIFLMFVEFTFLRQFYVFSGIFAFIKDSPAECNVAIRYVKPAEVFTFSNAGKVLLIIFGRLLFFPNIICDGLNPLWFINKCFAFVALANVVSKLHLTSWHILCCIVVIKWLLCFSQVPSLHGLMPFPKLLYQTSHTYHRNHQLYIHLHCH